MNKYEIMFIVKPDVEDDARNALIESFKGILTANGGTVDNVDEWGLRDLAYEIKDYKKGTYVVVDATCTQLLMLLNLNDYQTSMHLCYVI